MFNNYSWHYLYIVCFTPDDMINTPFYLHPFLYKFLTWILFCLMFVMLSHTFLLYQVMSEVGCKRLVFSSSSTVYGSARYFPTDEEHSTGVGITNPYGRSKYVCEQIMKDLTVSDTVIVTEVLIIAPRQCWVPLVDCLGEHFWS